MLVAEPSSFAARLKELREAAGVSQYRLAQLSGLAKQTLSQLEKGSNDPSWETVLKLAKALGVSVAEFAPVEPQTPDPTPPPPAPKRPRGKK